MHLRWVIRSLPQALNALSEFQHILDVFRAFGLQINMQKNVALMRLVGRETPGFLRKWVHRQKDCPFLQLPERHWRLPLVSKIIYLGIIVNYKAFDFDTTVRRIIAAQWCFRKIRSWLINDVHPFTTRIDFTDSVS